MLVNNRYSASFGHLIVSALILLTVYLMARTIWYPGYFYELDGGFEATKVVFIVDLALGPLLTLLIYKPKKKGLMFDLTCIGLMQLMALSYGVYLLYNYRPVALVLQNNEYFSVTADLYKNYEVEYNSESSVDSIKNCGLDCYIIKSNYESKTSIMAVGVPSRVRQEFYLDYAKGWQELLQNSKDLFDISELEEDFQTELKSAAAKLALENENMSEADLGFISVYGRYVYGYFIVQKSNGLILSFVEQKQVTIE